jgi:hypothetical protein
MDRQRGGGSDFNKYSVSKQMCPTAVLKCKKIPLNTKYNHYSSDLN